jgi:hypothetical protein
MRKGKIVKDNDFHRQITALAETLKIGWPRNVLRHSFISCQIAIVQSAEQVTLITSNSLYLTWWEIDFGPLGH